MSVQSTEFCLHGWDVPAMLLDEKIGKPLRDCNTCGGIIPAHWYDCTPEQFANRQKAGAWYKEWRAKNGN